VPTTREEYKAEFEKLTCKQLKIISSKYGAKTGKRKAITILNIVARIFDKPLWEDYCKGDKSQLELQADANEMFYSLTELKAHEQVYLLISIGKMTNKQAFTSQEREHLLKNFVAELSGKIMVF